MLTRKHLLLMDDVLKKNTAVGKTKPALSPAPAVVFFGKFSLEGTSRSGRSFFGKNHSLKNHLPFQRLLIKWIIPGLSGIS